ncbi:MAG TPA: insulinase family protein [Bacteroidales bacterium]|nr:insulinase family protein [Bacteroidales bacterium]
MMKNFIVSFFALFLMVSAAAQPALDRPIPVDPNVKIGKLKNGLTYYIQRNTTPPGRIEMRLAVNAGSILEDDDQQGLAHFVEHMAFNGTKRFTKNALVNFLERAGVRFGPDLNAYTSFDETVYMLQMPTDRPGLVDSAFMVLEEWAAWVAFEGEEIDKERGVIREEWRLGLGAEDRMRKQYFPVMFNGSRYAERLPIGTLGVIDTASHETLRRFYRDWYRPNLQAIVVVGDIDPAYAEAMIKKHFGKLKNPKNQRERKVFTVPDNIEPLVSVATDPEATNTVFRLMYKHPRKTVDTWSDYREQLMQRIYSAMMSARFAEINQKPESPFVSASSFYGGFMGRAINALTSFALIKENRIEDAVTQLVMENERVRRHGFTPGELERQKTELLAAAERRFRERDKTNSASLVMAYTANFLQAAPIPGPELELMLIRELLPTISLKDVNALAPGWITEHNMVAVLTAPRRDDMPVPDEAHILKLISAAKQLEVGPYEDSFTDEPLLAVKPQPLSNLPKPVDKGLGVQEFNLANGITLVVKPTDFKNDEILFTAFVSGGTSLASDEAVFAASVMPRMIQGSGIGNFSATDLQKKLTGQQINLQPFAEEFRHGFRGSVSPKDFETFLQLLHLHMQGARRDDGAFEALRSQLVSQMRFVRANPRVVFSDTLARLMGNNHPRAFAVPDQIQMENLNPETVYGLYDRMFTDATGMTVIVVGNLSNEQLPMLAGYLNNLPARNLGLRWKDHEVKFPPQTVDAKVYAGTENQSQVAVIFNGPFEWTDRNRLLMNLVLRAYNIKLRENMREELGGVYGVSARGSATRLPNPTININVGWGTNPGLVDTLTSVVFDQMKQLMENGPTDDVLAKVKETSVREREINEKQNNFWNSYLDFSYFNNTPLAAFEDYKASVESVSGAELRDFAKRFFKPEHYLRVVLYPENMRP